jgi:hypothetical protein
MGLSGITDRTGIVITRILFLCLGLLIGSYFCKVAEEIRQGEISACSLATGLVLFMVVVYFLFRL